MEFRIQYLGGERAIKCITDTVKRIQQMVAEDNHVLSVMIKGVFLY